MSDQDAAMKMLLKMGYKPGSGLGKREEGRTEPIQASLRPKNTGIGFAHRDQAELEPESGSGSDEKVVWSRKKISRKAKKGVDMDMDMEVGEESAFKVTDMTGHRHEWQGADDDFFTAVAASIRGVSASLQEHEQDLAALNQQAQSMVLLAKQLDECQRQLVRIDQDVKVLKSAKSMVARSRLEPALEPFLDLVRSTDDVNIQLSVLSLFYSSRPACHVDIDVLCRALDPQLLTMVLQLLWLPKLRSWLIRAGVTEVASLLASQPRLPPPIKRHLIVHYLHPKVGDVHVLSDDLKTVMAVCDPDLDADVYSKVRSLVHKELTALWTHARHHDSLALFTDWCNAYPESLRLSMSLQTIVPLLRRELSLVTINPRGQDMGRLKLVLPFLPTLPPALHAHLFVDSGLEGRLVQCLQAWIGSPHADPAQVAAFLQAWRRILPRPSISFRELYLAVNACLDAQSRNGK